MLHDSYFARPLPLITCPTTALTTLNRLLVEHLLIHAAHTCKGVAPRPQQLLLPGGLGSCNAFTMMAAAPGVMEDLPACGGRLDQEARLALGLTKGSEVSTYCFRGLRSRGLADRHAGGTSGSNTRCCNTECHYARSSAAPMSELVACCGHHGGRIADLPADLSTRSYALRGSCSRDVQDSTRNRLENSGIVDLKLSGLCEEESSAEASLSQ